MALCEHQDRDYPGPCRECYRPACDAARASARALRVAESIRRAIAQEAARDREEARLRSRALGSS